jgi:hypothetical protein
MLAPLENDRQLNKTRLEDLGERSIKLDEGEQAVASRLACDLGLATNSSTAHTRRSAHLLLGDGPDHQRRVSQLSHF